MNLHDEIEKVAYGLYEARGRTCGHELEDWLAAERMVLTAYVGKDIEEPEVEDFKEVAATVVKRPVVTIYASG